MKNTAPSIQARQRGVVLVIALLMLLVLTVLGLAATRSTALEERMTANQNDKEVAFEAAEAALRYGEGLLSAASQPTFSADANGAYTLSTMGTYGNWQTLNPDMWDSGQTYSEPYGNGVTTLNLILTGNGTGENSFQAPRYFIIYNDNPNVDSSSVGSTLSTDQQLVTKYVYYIYARGWGVTQGTTVTLEAIDQY
jgi:type IV pilus assembly protein PilX